MSMTLFLKVRFIDFDFSRLFIDFLIRDLLVRRRRSLPFVRSATSENAKQSPRRYVVGSGVTPDPDRCGPRRIGKQFGESKL